MRKFLSRAFVVAGLAALPSVALAQSFPGGGGGSLNSGVSPISGTCTNGYVLFNNAGVLGCQAASAASLSIGGSITGSTAGYGLYVNGAALGQFAYGTGVFTALGLTLNGSGALAGTTSPAFVTPALGAATGTSLALGSAGTLSGAAANALDLVNGANAQTFRVYNTWSSSGTNYERGIFDFQNTANVLSIGTQAAGTGVARNLEFLVGGVNKLDYGVPLVLTRCKTTQLAATTAPLVLTRSTAIQPAASTSSLVITRSSTIQLAATTTPLVLTHSTTIQLATTTAPLVLTRCKTTQLAATTSPMVLPRSTT